MVIRRGSGCRRACEARRGNTGQGDLLQSGSRSIRAPSRRRVGRISARRQGSKIVGCKDVSIHERDEVLHIRPGSPFESLHPTRGRGRKLGKAKAKGRIRRSENAGRHFLPALADFGNMGTEAGGGGTGSGRESGARAHEELSGARVSPTMGPAETALAENSRPGSPRIFALACSPFASSSRNVRSGKSGSPAAGGRARRSSSANLSGVSFISAFSGIFRRCSKWSSIPSFAE